MQDVQNMHLKLGSNFAASAAFLVLSLRASINVLKKLRDLRTKYYTYLAAPAPLSQALVPALLWVASAFLALDIFS